MTAGIRKSAEWMVQLDDRILEHLSREPWSSPTVMTMLPPFRASRGRIAERCEVLMRAGLIAPVWDDAVEITGEGERYLAGDLDAELLVF